MLPAAPSAGAPAPVSLELEVIVHRTFLEVADRNVGVHVAVKPTSVMNVGC